MAVTRRQTLLTGGAALLAGAAPRAAWGRTEADILVIGAGLAGLHAASLLEARGVRVIVIEGERRVGGRMHTLDDLPGAPEAGGVQIGSGYHRIIGLTKRHGIPLEPAPSIDRNVLYHIGGRSVTMADWPGSDANRLPAPERAIPPGALGPAFGARMAALPTPQSWMEPDAAALDISYAAALAQAGASAEAIRLIDANLNGNSVHSLSALHVARTAAIFRASPGPLLMIGGGSQRLPEAMAATLATPPRLGQQVAAIAESPENVTVTLTNGKTITARHALCTIPFAALRTIPIEAPIGRDLAALIAGLPYSRASFAYLAASVAFWKSDGLPETLWSDDPLIGRVFALGEDPPMLKVWLSGPNANRLDRMPRDLAAGAIIARIEAARPAARGKLRLARLFSWQRSPMARGIYHHIAPGQAATLAAGCRARGNRLHFAGEHLAQGSAGMEGSLESAEQAVATMLGRLGT